MLLLPTVLRQLIMSAPTFTGLQLMCLLYAGFKRLNPEANLQLDLNEPFLAALDLFQQQ